MNDIPSKLRTFVTRLAHKYSAHKLQLKYNRL